MATEVRRSRVPRSAMVALALALAMLCLGIYLGSPWVALGAIAGGVAAVAGWVFVYGPPLFGPHLVYDPTRLARRGRVTLLRLAYLGLLLFSLYETYESERRGYLATTAMDRFGIEQPATRFDMAARIAQNYVFSFFVMQNVAILLLTPVYVGSAIPEERETKTLQLLYATPLTSREIVLGKVGGRVLLLSSFGLAGLPILCLLQLLGGIDFVLLLGNELNSLLLLVTVASVCSLASALAPRVIWGVVGSYLILALPLFICGGIALGEGGGAFVLYDARAGVGFGSHMTVQNHLLALAIGYGVVSVVALNLAVLQMRGELRALTEASSASQPRLYPLFQPPPPPATPEAVTPASLPGLPDPEFTFDWPRLPPIVGDALLWKESYAGGRAVVYSPLVVCFTVLFVIFGLPFFLMGEHDPDVRRDFHDLYFFAFLLFYTLGACFRATSTVAREREKQTLDMLLQVPEERHTILRAKWIGSLRKGWPWLVMAAGALLLGLVLGAYSIFDVVWRLVAPVPMILVLTALALLLSVTLSTVLRANLTFALLLFAFGGLLSFDIVDRVFLPLPSPADIVNRPFRASPYVECAGVLPAYVALAAGLWYLALTAFRLQSGERLRARARRQESGSEVEGCNQKL